MSQERIVVLSWNLHWNILALFDLSKVNGISNFQSFRPANVCQQLSSSPKKGCLEKIIKQQIVVLKSSLAIVHLVEIIESWESYNTIHDNSWKVSRDLGTAAAPPRPLCPSTQRVSN